MTTPLDPRIDSPGREGLTGTARSSVYEAVTDRDQISLPPDGRSDSAQPAWRGDFPIDWPADHYVARRDFTRFLVLTSLAFSVGQWWIAVQQWWRDLRTAGTHVSNVMDTIYAAWANDEFETGVSSMAFH